MESGEIDGEIGENIDFVPMEMSGRNYDVCVAKHHAEHGVAHGFREILKVIE